MRRKWAVRLEYVLARGNECIIYTGIYSIRILKTMPWKHLSESQSYVTTDGQPASLSWNKTPTWGLRPDLYYLCDSYGLVLVGRHL
jgi:hypothetical protein